MRTYRPTSVFLACLTALSVAQVMYYHMGAPQPMQSPSGESGLTHRLFDWTGENNDRPTDLSGQSVSCPSFEPNTPA